MTYPVLSHPKAVRLCDSFLSHDLKMTEDFENPNFFCDKFCVWFKEPEQLTAFRTISDRYFTCIDRSSTFKEFVPIGYSKATGIQFVLEHYGLSLSDAYAFGDSNNDLSMLSFVPNSVAMGNASPASLFDKVSYVTAKASEDGIRLALAHFGFIEN